MEAYGVVCTSHGVPPSASTALAKAQINQCCLVTVQTSSHKGGDKKEEKEDSPDER
uniref:Putative mitochondrial translational initiation factor 2 n=1 Tax=Taeniopygia guttata TaxID=59729 RepID=B5G247_TAEGU|nr:putative mitochondrial translational initiation factor 2 [Taeniopygia guttata]